MFDHICKQISYLRRANGNQKNKTHIGHGNFLLIQSSYIKLKIIWIWEALNFLLCSLKISTASMDRGSLRFLYFEILRKCFFLLFVWLSATFTSKCSSSTRRWPASMSTYTSHCITSDRYMLSSCNINSFLQTSCYVWPYLQTIWDFSKNGNLVASSYLRRDHESNIYVDVYVYCNNKFRLAWKFFS